VRHDDVRAIATGPARAEGAWVEAEEFISLPTDRAFSAPDPRIGHHLVTDLDARSLRLQRRYLARDLVPHREWQADATRFERNVLTSAQIEVSIPDVHVAVADAGRLDAQQHLLGLRFGIGVFPRFQRLPPFDDLHCTHAGILVSDHLVAQFRLAAPKAPEVITQDLDHIVFVMSSLACRVRSEEHLLHSPEA